MKYKGCPICGREPVLINNLTRFKEVRLHLYWVKCQTHTHEVAVRAKTAQEAADRWNQRYKEPEDN